MASSAVEAIPQGDQAFWASKKFGCVRRDVGKRVGIEIRPYGADRPLPEGIVGYVSFERTVANAAPDKLIRRNVTSKVYWKKDVASAEAPVEVTVDALAKKHVSQILDARFSPDGKSAVLSILENARPVIVRGALQSDPLRPGVVTLEKLSTSPMLTAGIDWEPFARIFACNWVGGARKGGDPKLVFPLRGGIDELKVYG
jgi:hypothetical protein